MDRTATESDKQVTDKHSIKDYLNYIGAQVPAHKSGWCKMRCPFHSDGTASAAVNYDADRFKCFACGVTGDTYDLIMRDKGGTLREAIEFAQTISTTGDTTVRFASTSSSGLSRNSRSNGRRGSSISSGRRGRSASGS